MTSDNPLAVEVAPDYRVPKSRRKKAASKAGVVIHNYEDPFLDRLIAKAGTPVQEIDLKEPLKKLVMATAKRMKGFDLSDTVAYYQRIVNRAWKEAESIEELDVRTETVHRNFDWMMIDPDWDDRFHHWESGGYHYHPRWAPSHSGNAGYSTGTSTTPATPSTSRTGFSEVAASFAGWTENTSAGLVSAIEPGSLGISTPRGIADLSGVDRVTRDVFQALQEAAQSMEGSGGGGGGGGCACACAGCACACACAGGGR
jgi:hypothetical protein